MNQFINLEKNSQVALVDSGNKRILSIISGNIGVYNKTGKIINLLSKNDKIGYYEYFYKNNYKNDYITLNKVTLTKVINPIFDTDLLFEETQKMMDSLEFIVSLQSYRALNKTVKTIIWLCKKGKLKTDNTLLMFPFSNKLISDITNSTYETTSRNISYLKEKNILDSSIGYETKIIKNWKELNRLSIDLDQR